MITRICLYDLSVIAQVYSCGCLCPAYAPRNGMNGICRNFRKVKMTNEEAKKKYKNTPYYLDERDGLKKRWRDLPPLPKEGTET